MAVVVELGDGILVNMIGNHGTTKPVKEIAIPPESLLSDPDS